jgi:hypothetical protein
MLSGGLVTTRKFRALNHDLVVFAGLLVAAALAVAALAILSSRLGETELRLPVVVAFALALAAALGAILRLVPRKSVDPGDDPAVSGLDSGEAPLAIQSEGEYAIAAVAAEGDRALSLIREEAERVLAELRSQQAAAGGSGGVPEGGADAETKATLAALEAEFKDLARRSAELELLRAQAPAPERGGASSELDVPVETCAIHWWHGARRGGFEARAVRPNGSEYVFARSTMVRTDGPGDPAPGGTIEAAHKELVRRLERDGWEPTGTGASWYATSFRRPLAQDDGTRSEAAAERRPRGRPRLGS